VTADPVDPEAVDLLARAFAALGVTGRDPETARTPQRVAELYRQLFRGREPAPPPPMGLTAHESEGLVLVKDVPFYSMCAHHLLPFFGHASVAYLPRRQVVGLGAIVNVVEYFAARPQLQERLAEQVASYIDEQLQPVGVIVHLQARHMCVEMRGPARTSRVEFAAARGALVEGHQRDEFFRRLRG
jgi:GTP cyclohydrolase IA